MYKTIRNLHLYLGAFSFLFVLMYGLSAVQMAHNKWFNLKPRVATGQLALAPGQDARPVAQSLMDQHGLRGELTEPKRTPAGWDFRLVRPGTVYEVSYNQATGQTRVRTDTANFMGMLNRIHHVGGVWHDFLLTDIWGVFVGLISAALLGLGASGIYMWFQLHPERLVGLILLAASLGYSVTLLVLIRMNS